MLVIRLLQGYKVEILSNDKCIRLAIQQNLQICSFRAPASSIPTVV
jgi:hypothetical protein